MTSPVISRRQQRRTEILAAALDLLKASGFGKLTMKKIASRVGLSEAALYRYFDTKDELIFAIHGYISDEFTGGAREIVESPDLNAAEKCEASWLLFLEIYQKYNGFPLRLFAEVIARGDEVHLQRLRDIIAGHHEMMEELLSEAIGADCPISPREFQWVMRGVPLALATWGYLLGDQEDWTRVSNELVPFLMRCLTGGENTEMKAAD